MAAAGARRAFLVIRKGKWDLPEYYGDGSALGLSLGYLIMGVPHGPPYTLDQAYQFVRGARVLFGFPDILFGPDDAFAQALERLDRTQADVVLGLFRAHDRRLMDMIEVDRAGRVTDLVIKPRRTRLNLAWVFAVWSDAFTEFVHEHLAGRERELARHPRATRTELLVGHVIQAAIRAGLHVNSVSFPQGSYLDIGTPEGLSRAWSRGLPLTARRHQREVRSARKRSS